jgi:hypothetical protein
VGTVLAVLLIGTAVGIVGYWIAFALGWVQATGEDWYLRFQRAFPAPDGWVAACCTVAAVGLLSGAGYGVAFGLAAAGGLVFLGLVDVSFNLENGLYRRLPGSGEMWGEAFVNLWTLALGAWLVVYLTGRVG